MNGSFIRSLFHEKRINRTKLHILCREHQEHNWTPRQFLRQLKDISDTVIIDSLVTNARLNVDIVLNDKPIVPRAKPKRYRRTLADAFVQGRDAALKEMKLKQQSPNVNIEETVGFGEGKKIGLEEGKTIGLEEGKAIGYQEGIMAGLEEGKTIGLEEGKTIGLKEGKAIGLKEGKAIGLKEGKTIGYLEGITAGLKRSASTSQSNNHLKMMRGMTMKIIRDVHPDKAGAQLDSTYVTGRMNDLLAKINDALQTQ